MVWRSLRNNRVCCRRRMDGFVSNECGRLRFFDELIAAAAAIPTGPAFQHISRLVAIPSERTSDSITLDQTTFQPFLIYTECRQL